MFLKVNSLVHQDISFFPIFFSQLFAFENGFEPKNPRCDDNGEGCTLSKTKCLAWSTKAAFF